MLILVFAIDLIALMFAAYMFYLVVLIQDHKLGYKHVYKMSNALRMAKHICVFYRSLQILHKNALCFMSQYLAILHLLFTVFFLFVNFSFIRFWNELNWLIIGFISVGYIGCFSFWMFVLQIGKYLWIKGNNNFDSWDKVGFVCNPAEKKVMKKFKKSCRLILICHGKILLIGRMTQFFLYKKSDSLHM